MAKRVYWICHSIPTFRNSNNAEHTKKIFEKFHKLKLYIYCEINEHEHLE